MIYSSTTDLNVIQKAKALGMTVQAYAKMVAQQHGFDPEEDLTRMEAWWPKMTPEEVEEGLARIRSRNPKGIRYTEEMLKEMEARGRELADEYNKY